MTTDLKDITEFLPEILSNVSKHRDQQRAIEDYLVENNKMLRGSFLELLSNPDKASFLSDEETIVYVTAIHAITQDSSIDPRHFFSPKELKTAKGYEFEREETLSFPYTIAPMIRVTGTDYIGAMSYKELAALSNYNLITYNFDTQRLAKVSETKTGKIRETKNVKSKSVNAIKDLMKARKYPPSTLLLNVLVDGKSKIEYSPEGALTILEDSTLNIVDGAHRLEAIVRLIEEEPDFEGYMNVDIKHYTLTNAQKLIAITNTVNPFDKTLVKVYGGEGYSEEIVRHLMSIPVLSKRVAPKTAVGKKVYITNFAILTSSIEEIFKPEDEKQRWDTQETLVKFYEYLLSTYQSELVKNRIKSLESTWFSHHNMHVGFIVMAKKLFDKYGKDFPVGKIVEIIDGINFKKSDGSPLNEIMGGQGKTNSNKVKQQLREFIEKETDRILS